MCWEHLGGRLGSLVLVALVLFVLLLSSKHGDAVYTQAARPMPVRGLPSETLYTTTKVAKFQDSIDNFTTTNAYSKFSIY